MTRRSFGKFSFAAAFASAAEPLSALSADAPCRLRLGVLSDIHIPEVKDAEPFRKALKWFDAQKVDGVIVAGDLGFNGLITEMKVVADVWYEVFPDDKGSDGRHVEKLFITGNHDVDGYFYHRPEWPKVTLPPDPEASKNSFVFNRERAWKELFHEEFTPIAIKEVKGYKIVLHNWFSRMLNEENPLKGFFAARGKELVGEKPFFFVQHNHPKGTVYSPFTTGEPEGWGTDDYGSATAILENCPNAVAFSGHSHITLTDERSIWQGPFTSVAASACPGWAMAGALDGRDNFGWGAKGPGKTVDVETPKQGQLLEVYDDRLVLRRREFHNGRTLGPDWVMPWPISRGTPYSFEARAMASELPRFAADDAVSVTEKDSTLFVGFPTVRAGKTGVRALDYEVTCELKRGDVVRTITQKRVYSPGVLLAEEDDLANADCAFDKASLPSGKWNLHRFLVRPCDCWGRKGKPICTAWRNFALALFSLTLLGLSGCATGPSADAVARTDAAMNAAFDEYRLEYMNVAFDQHGETRYAFHRKAAVIKPGRGKYPEAPFGADTPLHVASITKVITATLVVQLVEEGKIWLSDPVVKHISEFPDSEITVLDLMTHTSGLRNQTGLDKKDHGKFYGTLRKEFERGTRFQYFSAGYDILADIIERVTGAKDVADVARARIFEPLRMAHTTLAPHQGQAGMCTTAPDMVRFGRHLLDVYRTRKAGIVTPAGADLLFRPVLNSEFHRTCAFFTKSGLSGFSQYFADTHSMRAVGHAGATGCYLLIDPEYDAVQVILTNSESNTIQRSDGNFARLNAVLLAKFTDSPMRARSCAFAAEEPMSARERKRRDLGGRSRALDSRKAAGEDVSTEERQLLKEMAELETEQKGK